MAGGSILSIPLKDTDLAKASALHGLNGVVMELDDCAFPLVAGVIPTDDPNVAFQGTDFAVLVGARPRGPGMERSDLLKANGAMTVPTPAAHKAPATSTCVKPSLYLTDPSFTREVSRVREQDNHARRRGAVKDWLEGV